MVLEMRERNVSEFSFGGCFLHLFFGKKWKRMQSFDTSNVCFNFLFFLIPKRRFLFTFCSCPSLHARIGVDRFSSLPDEVVHKDVVSFLSMEEISRLSVVWKRCRQLCISMSFLSLDVIPYRRNPFKRAQLMNYID